MTNDALINRQPKRSKPGSITITLVLMLFSAVPLAIGFLLVFVQTLVSEPSALLSLRAMLFSAVAFAVIMALVYGVIAIWKQKKPGYWIALLFLIALNVKNFYVFGTTVYNLLLTRQLQTVSPLGQASKGFAIFELAAQSLLVGLLLLLLLKVAFGKTERTFFFSPVI